MDRHTCKHTLSVNAGWSRQPEADGDVPPNNKKVVKKKIVVISALDILLPSNS